MARLRLLSALLAAAVAAVAGAASVDADGAPLTLEISTAQRQCAAGSLASVAWAIRGGAEPYRLTINGEPIDPRAGSASVRCGEPPPDALRWLWSVSPAVNVEARVIDASGASAEAAASLTPALTLPPPHSVSAWIHQEWADHRRAQGSIRARAIERVDPQSGISTATSGAYVLRWRERGTDTWTYDKFAQRQQGYPLYEEPPPGMTYLAYVAYAWSLSDLRAGLVYEFQISRVRDFAELEAPDRLRWTALRTMVSAGPPRDVTAHVTRDSITLSWESNVASTMWRASISEIGENRRDAEIVEPASASDSHRRSVRFSDLRPGQLYEVGLQQWNHEVLAEVEFDLRTSGEADDGSFAPELKITRTEVVNDELHIVWFPAAEREREYRIRLNEHGIRGSVDLEPRPGQTVAKFSDIKPETTYRLVIERLTGDRARAEQIVWSGLLHSAYESRNDDPTPNLYVNWRNAFHISWDSTYGDDHAQVRWERDGHTMSSFGAEPIVIDVDQPGRYAFRARFRREDGWSDWTDPVRAATRPLPPTDVRFDEQFRSLRIEWTPDESATPVDYWRVYVSKGTGEEQVHDVRGATEVAIPIAHDFDPHTVQIAAVNDALGEGQPSRPYRLEWRGRVYLRFVNGSEVFSCDPHGGLPAFLSWTVMHGAGPFTIEFSGQEPFQTSERQGSILIDCDTEGYTEIAATVTDALGISNTATVSLLGRPLSDEQTARSIQIDRARKMSVYQNSVHLNWHCWSWWAVRSWYYGFYPTFMLRWRTAASHPWTYINATAAGPGSKIYRGCSWLWTDLTPGTRYEFQLAAWLRPEQLDALESLEWSPIQTVTTLEDAQDIRTTLLGRRLIVTWRAQPHAWAYQVALRSGDSTRWKYYLPNGQSTERVVFDDAPLDGKYEVEIITPPQVDGRAAAEPGFFVFLP